MIFVILGTQDKKFPRLLDALQKKIDEGKISKKRGNNSTSWKYKI